MFLNIFVLLLLLLCLLKCNGKYLENTRNEYTDTINQWFSTVDKDLHTFNHLSAQYSWDMMTSKMNQFNKSILEESIELSIARNEWRNSVCDDLHDYVQWFTTEQQKRFYRLLCRGPKYTQHQIKLVSELMDNLSNAYLSSEVCFTNTTNPWLINIIQNTNTFHGPEQCLKGEPDLEQLMSRQDFTERQLFAIWKSWHDTVGPKVKQFYPQLVHVMNEAANNNNYNDIGETWREELELPNLENYVQKLYKSIEPLYKMLHAVIRYKLYEKYGPNIIDLNGLIPGHLLGNMWAQDWSPLIHLLIPNRFNLNEIIVQKKWSVQDMVLIAEDMYMSLGLPKMTENFWKYSKFERNEKETNLCHGTAANMFKDKDYRMLLCAELNMNDFYVIHHEMGHIEYYMAYENQPAVFQDGVNSAFQESIGDCIMTGVMTPQHLYRLGLISDEQLINKQFEIDLLLEQALTKLPQIPYALVIDLYRWNIFNGHIKPDEYNQFFWEINEKLRGIKAPEIRSECYFDAGAKFHIPDNTPYIRYFLSSILQIQMFKGMCEYTLFGNVTANDNDDNEERLTQFPLHKCDIYGSKKAGNKLKAMMELGASEHWSKPLQLLTGKNYINVKPFLEYYEPIYKWLQNIIQTYHIPVGW